MHKSTAIPGTVEFLDITAINPLISKCKIKVCYVGDTENRNKSIITEDTARKIAQSLPGSPIVGYYNEEKEDFESHNEYFVVKNGKIQVKTNTRPYGFVDTNAKVWFEEYLDDDTDRRKYMVTEGYLWTGQYPEANKIIEGQGNPQSLEFSEDERYLDAFWTKDGNGNNQFFIINEAVISKLCILGEDVEPCFEGSSVTQFSLEPDFKETMFNLMTEMKNILEKGVLTMEENKILDNELEFKKKEEDKDKPEMKDEGASNPQEDTNSKAKEDMDKKPEEQKKEDENKKKKTRCNLEEITEYDTLNESYQALSSQMEALNNELNELREYKNGIELDKKKDLIASFYMLSDEDKQDVNDNIASYSYDDIKSKLSIICVDKRVSFAAPEEQDNKADKKALTYNLDDIQDSSSANKPAWLKSVDNYMKNK